MSRILFLIIIVCFLFGSQSVLAKNFRLVALFPGKAMIEYQGKRILLKSGHEKNGFELLSTDTYAQTAEIAIDGQSARYELGRHIGGNYKQAEKQEVHIIKDNRGSYRTDGQINGKLVSFIVDTGANKVAMSELQARALGLDYNKDDQRVIAFTASGQTDAWRVVIDKVTIGGISLNDVDGMVVMGDSPAITLLGMSFLDKLDISQQDNLMILRQKF